MSLVDDFMDAEKARMSWLDRVIGNYPDVRTTSYYATPGIIRIVDQEKVIRPSILLRMQALVILFFLFLPWGIILHNILNNRFPLAVLILGFLFINFLIVFLLRNYFFSRKYNYTISVTASGITIEEAWFPWDEIAETCIMSRQEGRSTNNYLIVFKKDRSVKKCDLWLFGISSKRLSVIVEHFKKQHYGSK